jgi:hypothetical protein
MTGPVGTVLQHIKTEIRLVPETSCLKKLKTMNNVQNKSRCCNTSRYKHSDMQTYCYVCSVDIRYNVPCLTLRVSCHQGTRTFRDQEKCPTSLSLVFSNPWPRTCSFIYFSQTWPSPFVFNGHHIERLFSCIYEPFQFILTDIWIYEAPSTCGCNNKLWFSFSLFVLIVCNFQQ